MRRKPNVLVYVLLVLGAIMIIFAYVSDDHQCI